MYLIRFRYASPAEAELQKEQPQTNLTWTGVFELAPSARDYTTHQGHLYQVISRRPLSFAESVKQRSLEMHGISALCSVKWVHKMSDRQIPADEEALVEALDAYL